jgi:hypothetical protein
MFLSRVARMLRLPARVLGVSLLVALCGCSIGPYTLVKVTPTATVVAATPTVEPSPTAPVTPVPTATPTPEPTPTSAPAWEEEAESEGLVLLGDIIRIPELGYAYQYPVEMQYYVQWPVALIYGKEMGLLLMLGGDAEQQPYEATDFPEQVETFAEKGGEISFSPPVTVTISGIEGPSVDLMASEAGTKVRGRLISIDRGADGRFFLLAVSRDADDEDDWENGVLPILDAVAESIVFWKPGAGADTCPASTDPTYGVTQERPVRIGGGQFGGRARARAYLEALRGTQGQISSYRHVGPVQTGGSSLEEYELSTLGAAPISIYIDAYSYSQPQVPAGLRCAYPFPLSEP